MDYQKLMDDLLLIIPKEQQNEVFSQDKLELSYDYLGFIDVYYHLSKIIPEYFIVIDFGCGYNAQSFYFLNHKKYISVDESKCIKFKSPNCEIHNITIEEFIVRNQILTKETNVFVICSYVPSDTAQELVRKSFEKVFVYYPGNNPKYNIKLIIPNN